MEQELLELLNEYGIVKYTFFIGFIGFILATIHDLLCQLSGYINEKARYYYDKRKEELWLLWSYFY